MDENREGLTAVAISKSSYTLALINAWFSMLGCGTAAVLLLIILPELSTLPVVLLFIFAAWWNLITSISLWNKVMQ